MTQDEAVAILSTIETADDACYDKIQAIERAHNEACKRETTPLEEERTDLADQKSTETARCLAEADYLPFSPLDFITQNGLDFYQVKRWSLNYSLVRGLDIYCYVYPIRKSGVLAKFDTSIREWKGYRLADLSEDLRLRRCLKLRLRRRLEGGN